MMIRETMIYYDIISTYVMRIYAHDLSPKYIRNKLNFVQSSPDNKSATQENLCCTVAIFHFQSPEILGKQQ